MIIETYRKMSMRLMYTTLIVMFVSTLFLHYSKVLG